MKSYHMLAYKELLAQKVTSVLIIVAFILSTMMTTTVGQSVGMLAAMREQQAITIGGSSYATMIQMNKEQVNVLLDDARLSYIGSSIVLGSMELSSGLTLGLTEYIGDSLEAYPSLFSISEGELPKKAMEIALPEDALQFLGFTGNVGDKISISASKALRHGIELAEFDFNTEFTLTGILKNNYLGYTAGSIQGIVGTGTAEEILPNSYIYYNVDICTVEKKTFQSTMDDLIANLQVHELDIQYNTTYLNTLGIPHHVKSVDLDVSDIGFSFMLFAGILVVILVYVAAGLVIYNILKIAVTKRIGQYGTLRAVGAEKGQLYLIVVIEVLLLCIIGIPIGMLFGYLSAEGILKAAVSQLNPEIFLVQDIAGLNQLIAENSTGKGIFLLISPIITLFFAFIAALPAAHFAAKVSPVLAMSGKSVKIKRGRRSSKKIRNIERYYAWLNLKRNRGRTTITILSLVMSITVFITLQGFVSLLSVDSSEDDRMGDYSIVNKIVGFSSDDLKTLEADESIATLAAMQFSEYLQNEKGELEEISLNFKLQIGESFQVVGLNDVYIRDYFEGRLSEEQLKLLEVGKGCIVRNPIPLTIEGEEYFWTNIEEGTTIVVGGKELLVLGTLDGYDGYFSVGNSGFVNGIQVIANDSLYTEMTGLNNYSEIFPILKNGSNRESFDLTLESFCQSIPGTSILSYEQTDQQLKESSEQIYLLAWGLILFIGLIGILNIINTVYTNIHTRIAEIGTQRAIGMSTKSLYKTFLWEGVYYGVIASIIGSVLGYIFIIFVGAASADQIELISVPIIPMVEAIVLTVVVCLVTTCIPLRKIAQMSIVDSIESAE